MTREKQNKARHPHLQKVEFFTVLQSSLSLCHKCDGSVYDVDVSPESIDCWNDLPESLISSSELSGDSVSKFTSLVRARD